MKGAWLNAVIGAAAGVTAVTAVINPNVFLRVAAVVTVMLLALVYGYRIGVLRMQVIFHRSTDWMPRDITWHEDDEGGKHALVTRLSGELVTIDIPDEIDNAYDAMRYIVSALAEDE